jgi:hypothetical protein
MSDHRFFFDRRKGTDRRLDRDPCKYLPMDLYHRKRRKSKERRTADRTLQEDVEAFLAQPSSSGQRDPDTSH